MSQILESMHSNAVRVTPAAAVGYSKFRLTITVNNLFGASTGTRELELRIAPGGPNVVPGLLDSASASHFLSGFPASLAADGSYANGDGWITNNALPQYIQFDLTEAVSVAEYAVGGYTTATDTENRSPNSWTLEGSNDGETWEEIDSQSGVTWGGHDFSTPKVFTL